MFATHPEMFVFVLEKELLGKERLYTSEGRLRFGRHASGHMTPTSLLFHLLLFHLSLSTLFTSSTHIDLYHLKPSIDQTVTNSLSLFVWLS